MLAVLVHGVPDTVRVWDSVRANLADLKTEVLALPGLGSPMPEGFRATKEEYVDWLIAQLECIGEPVHLVGHDWGCMLTARVASLRPDLLRSWAGGSGPISMGYEWHVFAKTWQTPEVGEQWMADLDPKWFSGLMQQYGVDAQTADQTVSRIDPLMKDCILRLYRSAVHVGDEWEPGLKQVTAPSLVFWGLHDELVPAEYSDRLAAAMGATPALKLDAGHWTPLQRPAEVAAALRQHWLIAEQNR